MSALFLSEWKRGPVTGRLERDYRKSSRTGHYHGRYKMVVQWKDGTEQFAWWHWTWKTHDRALQQLIRVVEKQAKKAGSE